MEACLSDNIDGRCSDVKCRVTEVEHQTERFIALEMSRTEAEAGHAEIQKRRRLSPRGCPRQPFPRAREVSWRNLWLSRGSSLWGSHPPPPPPAQDVIDGPNGHCIETHHQDHEFGAESSHAHIPVNGTHMPPPRVEPAPDQFCLPLSNSSSDLVSVA
jgi:hypothetical protein